MRVLVVEDDVDTRNALRESLSNAGYAVDEAHSAEEARGLTRVYPYDGMLIDVGLPEGRDAGLTLIRTLRDEGHWAPVIFLTGRTSLDDRLSAFAVGGDDYITKP